ncbi:MAG: IS200/IS605 family transposase [Candidatus Thermoplasmatota archaeon]|nr:IS200/IS605 family transposase [Candidatus Thermoplasmatota archaeon]
MSQSLSNVLTHIVFSTKKRQSWLHKEICKELYPYINTILKNNACHVYQIGGMTDHIHIVCALGKTISISKLIEEIKKSTSKWIKTKDKKFADFYWQNGYGIFSISTTHLQALKFYVANQEKHHKTKSFQDEFIRLLQKNDIAYNAQYLWD